MNIKRNIVFTLESRKKDGKAIVDNIPIRMRVMYAGKRIDFSTGYRIDKDKWDEGKQRVKNGCTNKLKQTASEINGDLLKYFTDIQSIFKEFEVKGVNPTPEQIKEAFNQKYKKVENEESNKMAFMLALDEFVKECGIQNNWTEATYEKFAAVKNHLSNFDANLTFEALDDMKLTEYVNYLREKKNMRNSTIGKQLGFLKWFLRWGLRKGYNNNNTFEGFKPKLKTTQKKVVFLTWKEVMQLRDYEIPETKKYLDRVRDVFLFTCFTGLRYSDVYNLKWSDIKEDHIEITTIKTADSLKIDLNKFSRPILDKYRDIHFEGNKALPVISNQNMNDYLKELGELAGLDEPITEIYYKGNERIEETTPKYALLSTHAGRRTFICNSLTMGIPAQTVMKWTGHSDYKAMKPYIDIADEDRKEAMKVWDKKEDEDTDKEKLLEQLKKLNKNTLAELLKKLS